jgi:hypothetical protein
VGFPLHPLTQNRPLRFLDFRLLRFQKKLFCQSEFTSDSISIFKKVYLEICEAVAKNEELRFGIFALD